MVRRRRAVYTDEATGLRFLFLYDREQPELLHVMAAHQVSPEEAIELFFSGGTSWNAENLRHETFSATQGLY